MKGAEKAMAQNSLERLDPNDPGLMVPYLVRLRNFIGRLEEKAREDIRIRLGRLFIEVEILIQFYRALAEEAYWRRGGPGGGRPMEILEKGRQHEP